MKYINIFVGLSGVSYPNAGLWKTIAKPTVIADKENKDKKIGDRTKKSGKKNLNGVITMERKQKKKIKVCLTNKFSLDEVKMATPSLGAQVLR